MSDELKPCPFCGGEAKCEIQDGEMFYFVECVDCGNATCGWVYESRAIEKWNARPALKPTIADCLKTNEAMLTKTKAKMVSIESLKEFAGIKDSDND